MRIVRHAKHCPEAARHSVLALGNFDGVHLGHREILKRIGSIAHDSGLLSAVMTFEPHPVTVLKPNTPPLRITPFRQKAELLREAGMDVLFVQHFDERFSRITAEDFIRDILVKQLHVRHLVIGHDFIFGHRRGGNAELLRALSGAGGYTLTQVGAQGEGGVTISSSRIRQHLQAGEIRAANALLGHAYTLEGHVRKGQNRGTSLLNCPTANMYLKDHLRPAFGVYIAEARIENGAAWLPAITHIGTNVMFGGEGAVVETHLLDFSGDLYGKKLCVKPLHFLRPEENFTTVAALRRQMEQDIACATEHFNL